MELMQSGMNPRDVLRSHKERGMIRYSYTNQELADLFEISIDRTRHLISEKKFNPKDLKSIIDYYNSKHKKQQV